MIHFIYSKRFIYLVIPDKVTPRHNVLITAKEKKTAVNLKSMFTLDFDEISQDPEARVGP